MIGLPGEEISYKNDHLYIDGKLVEESFFKLSFIQKEKENLERYTNLENLLRETEKASLQIEKLGTDGTELQNRQKEMKAVLEEKQKEYQTTDGAEKEKAETDSGKRR